MSKAGFVIGHVILICIIIAIVLSLGTMRNIQNAQQNIQEAKNGISELKRDMVQSNLDSSALLAVELGIVK